MKNAINCDKLIDKTFFKVLAITGAAGIKENPHLTDNWDDNEGYYSKIHYIVKSYLCFDGL